MGAPTSPHPYSVVEAAFSFLIIPFCPLSNENEEKLGKGLHHQQGQEARISARFLRRFYQIW